VASDREIECRSLAAVQDGCCLIVKDGASIIYAGPIAKAPNFDDLPDGAFVYVSPADIEVLRAAGMTKKLQS
jgi:hypothetical protein